MLPNQNRPNEKNSPGSENNYDLFIDLKRKYPKLVVGFGYSIVAMHLTRWEKFINVLLNLCGITPDLQQKIIVIMVKEKPSRKIKKQIEQPYKGYPIRIYVTGEFVAY